MSIGAKRVIKAVLFSVLALIVLVAVVITVLTVMYNVYYDKPLNDNANKHETTYLPNGLHTRSAGPWRRRRTYRLWSRQAACIRFPGTGKG